MIHLTINQKPVAVPEGTTILEAARSAGIEIPSLCYLKNVHRFGSCRICVVEVEGMRTLQASCMTRAREGMVVHTHSARVRARRKVLYELMLSSHSKDCLSCGRNQSCELQALGERLGVTSCRLSGEQPPRHVDVSPAITRTSKSEPKFSVTLSSKSVATAVFCSVHFTSTGVFSPAVTVKGSSPL